MRICLYSSANGEREFVVFLRDAPATHSDLDMTPEDYAEEETRLSDGVTLDYVFTVEGDYPSLPHERRLIRE